MLLVLLDRHTCCMRETFWNEQILLTMLLSYQSSFSEEGRAKWQNNFWRTYEWWAINVGLWYSCEWRFPCGGQEILAVDSPALLMGKEPSCTAAGERSHLLHVSGIAQELDVNKVTVQCKDQCKNLHYGDMILLYSWWKYLHRNTTAVYCRCEHLRMYAQWL